jgi:sugar phosphate isomerase/epimerase
MNRAKIIVETSPYWHYTIDYMMSSIEAAGFSAIELWTAAPHYCFADAPEAMKGRRAEICDCAKAHGLTIPVFSPEQMVKYPWNIASPDPYMEKKSIYYR